MPKKKVSHIRTVFSDCDTDIWGWPSKGGLITLEADAVDFEFLGLDRLDPPMKRLADQAEEDEFCKRLLLLGAHWWSGSDRRALVLQACEDENVPEFLYEQEPLPTRRERAWVEVGWPTVGGGVWVTDWDTGIYGVDGESHVPFDISRLRMAHTMDERCRLLRERFGARFSRDPKDCAVFAELFTWEEEMVQQGKEIRADLGHGGGGW